MNTPADNEGDVEVYELSERGAQSGDPSHTSSQPHLASSVTVTDADPIEGVTVQELPPMDKGWRAWSFCMSAFVVEMMVWGFSYSYGIFQDYYTSHPPFDTSSTVSIAAVGTISFGLQYGEVLWLSLLFGRYPDYMRMTMWAGLALYFVSLFASSFATEVWQLILLQGVGVGMSGGMLYIPIIKLTPEWFSERRGLAGGIIFSGTAVGGFVFPFVLNALLEKVGYRWTLRIWAITSTLCAGIAFIGMKSRYPVPKFRPGQRRPKFIPSRLPFFRNELFWCISATNLLQGLSYFPVSLGIATFTRSIADQFTATIVLAVFNLSGIVGRVLVGHLVDVFPYPFVMFISMIGSGASAFLLWGLANAPVDLYVFAIIFSGLSSGFSSTWFQAGTDLAGDAPQHTGLAIGGITFFKGVAAVTGPIMTSLLLEAGKGTTLHGGFGRFGYGFVEIFVGSCAVAAAFGSVAVALVRRRVVLS